MAPERPQARRLARSAVGETPAPAGVDAVVLNGDLADGPMPDGTLDRLEALGDQAIWVRGNSDRDLAAAYDGTYRHSGLTVNAPAEYIAWSAARIGQAHRDRLASLPARVSLDIDGLGPVAFCHGTARDDNEFILVDSPTAHFQAAFAGVAEQMVVLGHTHMPFDRLAGRLRVVNPGSVGLPYGHAGAAWALLGPDVVLRQTLYDTDAAIAAITAAAPDMPGAAFLTGNILASASDSDALAAFRAVSRRHARRRWALGAGTAAPRRGAGARDGGRRLGGGG